MEGPNEKRKNQLEEETTNDEHSSTDDEESKEMNEMRKKLDPRRGEQYRETTLGRALSISLKMIESGKMPQSLASKILMHFDVHMEAHLKKCSTRVIFKTDRLTHYKEYRSNYFLYLEKVEFTGMRRLGNFHINVDKVQVTAVASKALLLHQEKKNQNKMNKGNEKGNKTSAAVVTQNSD